jgi:hypothetical protein
MSKNKKNKAMKVIRKSEIIPTSVAVFNRNILLSFMNSIELKSEIIEKYDKLNDLRKNIDVENYSVVYIYLIDEIKDTESVFFIDICSFLIESEKLEVLKNFKLLYEHCNRKIEKINKIFERNYKIAYIHNCKLKHAATEFLKLVSPQSILKYLHAIKGIEIKKICYINELIDKKHDGNN